MNSKALICFVILSVIFVTGSDGVTDNEPSNYDISRNSKLGVGNNNYGNYIPDYPEYPGQYGGQYGVQYGGQYGGQYPHKPQLPGPPGAHPGCPLCDSSVYSYCSYKQSHDSCCCDGSQYNLPFSCRKADCKFLYANSCQEYHLISSCCCVDLEKSAAPQAAFVAPVVPVVG